MTNQQPPLLVNTLTRRERQVASLIKEVKNKHKQLQSSRAAYDILLSKHQKILGEAHRKTTKEAMDMLAKLSPEAYLVGEYKGQMAAVERDKRALKRRLDDSREVITSLEKKVQQLERELLERDAQITKLQQGIRTMHDEHGEATRVNLADLT